MRTAILLASALALSATAVSSAFASEAECGVIAKAMLAVADQPAVRQTVILADGKSEGIASVLLKDAMYVREAASEPWRKMPVGAAKRKTMAEQALAALPLSDCEAGAGETADGASGQIYSFKQPDPMTPGSKSSSRILIGSAGLPLRMDLGDGSAMKFEYGDFKAPTP